MTLSKRQGVTEMLEERKEDIDSVFDMGHAPEKCFIHTLTIRQIGWWIV